MSRVQCVRSRRHRAERASSAFCGWPLTNRCPERRAGVPPAWQCGSGVGLSGSGGGRRRSATLRPNAPVPDVPLTPALSPRAGSVPAWSRPGSPGGGRCLSRGTGSVYFTLNTRALLQCGHPGRVVSSPVHVWFEQSIGAKGTLLAQYRRIARCRGAHLGAIAHGDRERRARRSRQPRRSAGGREPAGQ